MTTTKETKARVARVKKLAKTLKRVDTSKVVLPEEKTVSLFSIMEKPSNYSISIPFLGTLTVDQISEGKERFLSAVNGTKQKSLKKSSIKKQGREVAI